MTWKVRHEGSPQAQEGLTQEQVLQGLLDAQWEPTDEVMGPQDTAWVALESHPQFAEAAADIEPPPPHVYDDETRLDMTALIDVTMVLLIFFILTTTYASLQKLIDAANVTSEKSGGVRVVTEKDVAETMVRVKLTLDGEQVSVRVEDGEPFKVDRDVYTSGEKAEQRRDFDDRLTEALGKFSSVARRRKVLLEVEYKVPHAFNVAVQDAAKSARMEEVLFLLP